MIPMLRQHIANVKLGPNKNIHLFHKAMSCSSQFSTNNKQLYKQINKYMKTKTSYQTKKN